METNVEYKNRASIWQLAGFAGNNAATNANYIIISSFFLAYATTIYGFSAWLVGIVMMATRLFDAVTDPIIGVMVDRTDSKLGRFRPWIIAGSILSNIMFLLLFSGLDLGNNTLNLIVLIAIYVVWVIGYTFQTSISKAGQNVLTSDPNQRTTLNAISGIFSMVVYMGSLSLFPVLVKDPGSVGDWQNLVYVIIGLQLFFTAIALMGIWKKDVPENYSEIQTTTEKPKAKDYISLFKNNKALQMLIVAASTNKISLGVSGGLLVFFYAYVVGVPELQAVVTPTSLIFILLATFFALWLTRRLGRKKAFTWTSLAAAIFSIVAILLIPIAPSNTILLILVLGIYGFNNTATDMNVIPMIGDAADFENYQSGRFIPGMIGTAFSLIDKVVSSLSSVISGGLLSILGFVSLTETEASPALFWGILIAYFAFPALGHFASVIAMKFYPLDNEKMAEMALTLEARRNGQEA